MRTFACRSVDLVFLILVVTLAALPVAGAGELSLSTRDRRLVRSVAIISRLGDSAAIFHAVPSGPAGVFDARTKSVLIPDFRIDARIAETIAGMIKPLGVVPLSGGDNAALLHWDRETAGENIRKLPPRADIDAYIVVCPDDSFDEVGKTMLTIRGYGLYHRWRLFTYTTAVYAIYRVMLIDARTGETIADRESGIESGLFESSVAKNDLDRSRWPGDAMDLTPDQLQMLKQDLVTLFDRSLHYTLGKMNLRE